MDILYHASINKRLKLIEPQRTLSKDKYIGDYVFATADRRLAVMYLATRGVATLMNTKRELRIILCSDEQDYICHDSGGAIYELPAVTFTDTPQEGLSDFEFVSREPVKPIASTIYKKSLDAFLSIGAKIYFVDVQMFEKLVVSKDESRLVSTLRPYLPK